MRWWLLFAVHGPRILFDEKKEGEGGGAGGGGNPPPNETEKTLAELKAAHAALLVEMEKLKSRKHDEPDDDDLRDKARKQREIDEKRNSDSKALENALRFQLSSDQWLKTNSSLLPKDISDIFKASEKENYANAIEKDQAVKAGIVQSFFSVQNNLDLLTSGQKSMLDDYLKLTKTGKQERAQSVYDTLFEPALEMLRRVKKAEALAKGHGSSSDSDDAYKQKMMSLSSKHYFGEKANAT
jgi:hydroxylamine reductase (hybrid-cluster protein)